MKQYEYELEFNKTSDGEFSVMIVVWSLTDISGWFDLVLVFRAILPIDPYTHDTSRLFFSSIATPFHGNWKSAVFQEDIGS